MNILNSNAWTSTSFTTNVIINVEHNNTDTETIMVHNTMKAKVLNFLMNDFRIYKCHSTCPSYVILLFSLSARSFVLVCLYFSFGLFMFCEIFIFQRMIPL
eukprot:450143_1